MRSSGWRCAAHRHSGSPGRWRCSLRGRRGSGADRLRAADRGQPALGRRARAGRRRPDHRGARGPGGGHRLVPRDRRARACRAGGREPVPHRLQRRPAGHRGHGHGARPDLRQGRGGRAGRGLRVRDAAAAAGRAADGVGAHRRRHPRDRAARRRGAGAAGAAEGRRGDRRLRPRGRQRRRGEQDRHLRPGASPRTTTASRSTSPGRARPSTPRRRRARTSRSSNATGERCARPPASTRRPRSGTLPST